MTRKLVIIGAGPVGCLAAISLANMGWSVEIYESRSGISLSFTWRIIHFHKVDLRYALAFFPGSRPAAID